MSREYHYWTNPARYYGLAELALDFILMFFFTRHRTFYPRYLPRYRSRYYK